MIQRNAIQSWIMLPEVEVMLLGAEQGIAEISHELGARHLPLVGCNSAGTPLISSMFNLVRQHTRSDLLCIINADILLMDDFLQSARLVASLRDRFVMLSQRWDLDITQPLDFSTGWQERLRSNVLAQNNLHRPAGSDFFLFPSACYQQLPEFTIGRAGWDNWMIYKAHRQGWSIIDATPSIMLVHQNHDYSHLPGGKSHYDHPDTNQNIHLAGGQANIRYTILDSTHHLLGGKLVRPPLTAMRFERKLELFLRALFFFLPEKKIEGLARPRRWKKRFAKWFK